MRLQTFYRGIIFPLVLILAIIACTAPVASPTQENSTAIPELPTEPLSQSSPTAPPTALETETAQATESAAVPATATATPGPTCTVLTETLNLRNGPSQLYRPPILSLPANSVLIPLGFLPNGLIQGRWAYVQDMASQKKGWVSAEPNFISCTVDLSSLPPVDYEPPPPYTPVSDTSPGPGTCGDIQVSDIDSAEYNCDVVYSNNLPVQFIVYKNGKQAGKADGVKNVVFTVEDKNGKTIYSSTENNAAYCLFGGDAPCSSWTLDNYLYRWGPGGPLLESGKYTLKINPTLEDPTVNLFWSADINVTLPF